MSERLHHFQHATLLLPYDLAAQIKSWDALRGRMIREVPSFFRRDEWAYLITFLEEGHLWSVIERVFGARGDCAGYSDRLYYPRGKVAIWLPNNVSLLGPLLVVLLSLTGNRLRFKGGSRSQDLCQSFIAFAQADQTLKSYLDEYVSHEVFDTSDRRNAEMSASGDVRIVFGGDAAARKIEALDHPLNSVFLPFTDRRSEAWIDPVAADDEVLKSLARVFMIYGQAGCTSPARVILIDNDQHAAKDFRRRLLKVWPRVVKRQAEPHVASNNFMVRQWAAGVGWDAVLTDCQSAVIGIGAAQFEPVDAHLFLPISTMPLNAAIDRLPANIQTIGHALEDPRSESRLARLAKAGVKRFVPLAHMHHFGPIWDGYDFWQQTFECMEVQL